MDSNLNISLSYRYNCEAYFGEVGLPSGSIWWINLTNISGAYTLYSRSNAINWTAFPGSYQFLAASAARGYRTSSIPQRFQLGPSGFRANLTFSKTVYSLTFTESGLGSNTPWWLDITYPNGTHQNLTSSTYSLGVSGESGLYGFSTGTVGYTAIPSAGTVSVGTANVTYPLQFVPIRFSAAFLELGLPSGTVWWINLTTSNGSHSTVYSRTAWINMTLPPGTYRYVAGAVGYATNQSSGTFALQSSGFSRPLLFFSIVSGLLHLSVRPIASQVWVDGVPVNLSSVGTALLSLPPGTHSVEASEANFVSYFNNVTIISGRTANLTIQLTPVAMPASPIPFSYVGTLGLLLITVLLITTVALAVALIYAWRKPPSSRAPPAPPEEDVDEDTTETWLAETEDLPP